MTIIMAQEQHPKVYNLRGHTKKFPSEMLPIKISSVLSQSYFNFNTDLLQLQFVSSLVLLQF